LSENINQLILREGYENKVPPLSYGYIYAQNKTEKLNTEKILPTTIKIKPENNYNNLTYFKFNKWFADAQTCYGTVINNEIIAYAALNYPPNKKTSSIGVGTIESERRKGYALSNTVAVAKDLIENGNDASYRCSNNNIASQHIAKNAGFEFIAKKYEIFCEHI
jgi:predicted GNAT family acetyltransferase